MKHKCPYCTEEAFLNSNSELSRVVKSGRYYRQSDRKSVQRYSCRVCKNSFSSSTFGYSYYQKKRHLNTALVKLLSGGVSLRESAQILNLNRKTVSRKLRILGFLSHQKLKVFNKSQPKCVSIEFDDMETFEHTKCKPVAISLAVEEGTRRILDFQICKQPAKGLLARKSLKKYGKRTDERPYYRKLLFKNIKDLVVPRVVLKSDESTHYINDVKRFFKASVHLRYKGRRGCVVGQGELKTGGFDPLFSLNHTAAMARYKVSRLVRRTWSTTKKIEALRDHFAIMALQHNLRLNKLL
jgi:transposase-like protein